MNWRDPRQVRDFARATGQLAKSDRIDAEVLALFAQRLRPRVAAAPPAAHQAVLQDLISRRRQLVAMRTQELNRQQDAPGPFAATQIKRHLRLLEQQLEDLDRELARLIERDDDLGGKARVIDSVPGVSATTAHALVAELPELGRLDRAAIAKLVGVAPLDDESGRFRGRRRIRGGRASVRTALYMPTLVAMRCNPLVRAFAQQLRARGKCFKQVVVACMRKLLIVLNTLVKENRPWREQPT